MAKKTLACARCRKPFTVQVLPDQGIDEFPAFVPESYLEPDRLTHDCGAILEVSIYDLIGIMVVELPEAE